MKETVLRPFIFFFALILSMDVAAIDWEREYQALPFDDGKQSRLEVERFWTRINESIIADIAPDQWSCDLSDRNKYQAFTKRWNKLDKKLNLREQLIPRLGGRSQGRVLGFGPSGVRHLKLELTSLHIRACHTTWLLFHGAVSFVDDSLVSPVPIFFSLFKFSMLTAAFIYWRRFAIPVISGQSKSEWNWKSRLSWWYLRVHDPIEWLLFSTIVISTLATLWEFIDFLPIQVVLNWSLGGIILLRSVDAWRASQYRHVDKADSQAMLRLKSIKLAGSLFIVAYAIRALLFSLEAGGGTLQYWIKVLLLWLAVPVTLAILNWWRPVMLAIIESGEVGDNPLIKWIKAHPRGVPGVLAALLSVVYLSIRALALSVLGMLSQQDVVKTWLAYFFRVEVARQAAKDASREDLIPFEGEGIQNLMETHLPDQWLEDVADAELTSVAELSCHKRSTISLIHAGRGGGKSSFLRRLEAKVAGRQSLLRVECLPGGFNEVIDQIALAMGIDQKEGRSKLVLSRLKNDEQLIVCIDDLQRIICPAIGGLHELDRLVRLIRSSSQSVSWVLAIETPSWRFVERARGERFMFDIELTLPRWSDTQIDALIQYRVEEAKINPSFDALEIPQGFSPMTVGSDGQSSVSYSRMLWDYAKGNPRVSLGLWRRSLYSNDKGDLQVKLFSMPDTTDLDAISVPLLLVLRAVLQLELGEKSEIARCTNLNSDEVVDALRLLVSRGYVEKIGDHFYGIKWFWYRTITLVLDRQHLLKI